MYYSDNIIEEVRERNDIVKVVSEYVRLEKKGSSYFGLCPFHNEKSPSFSVSGQKQMFYCFGCGEGGNVFSFVMKYENFTFTEAVKALADKAGMQLPEAPVSAEEKKKQDIKTTIYEVNAKAAMFYYKILKSEYGARAYGYFKDKRKLSDDTIIHFGLGASGTYKDALYRYLKEQGYGDDILKETGLFIYKDNDIRDRFFNRAMFPILNIGGKVIGFGGRVMGDGEPKYLNSPETTVFEKGRNLFGLNFARSSKTGNLIICEGYMDVIALHQAGFTQAVASLGTALTQGHAVLMKRYVKDILVCYDSDGAGTKAAIRAIGILRDAGLRTKVIDMKPYKDPDEFIKELGAKEFQKRIDGAMNGFMFELSVLEKEYNLKDPDGKTAFLNEAALRLVEFKNEIERNNYIETVAADYFVSPDSLSRLVAKQAAIGVSQGSGRRPGSASDYGDAAGSRAGAKSTKNNDDGIKKTQRLLLTWLIEEPGLFSQIAKYIEPTDFTEPLYYQVAMILYKQLEAGELNPASIISGFSDAETHNEVARIFNTELPDNMEANEKQKAINDIVTKVKNNSFNAKIKSSDGNLADLQRILQEKNAFKTVNIIFN